MKTLLLFLILSIFNSFAQNLDQTLKANICECLEEIALEEEFPTLEKYYINCIASNIKELNESIHKEYKSDIERKRFINFIVKNLKYCSPYVSKIVYRIHNESDFEFPKDENDELFNNWEENNVIISDSPINYKEGAFDLLSDSFTQTKIIRAKDYQYEIDPVINDTLKFKLTWVNNYEYDLEYLGNTTEYKSLTTGHTFKVKIISITNEGYSCLVQNNTFKDKKAFKFSYKKIY